MGCCGPSKKEQPKHHEADKNLSPIDLLKVRLARGDISFDEYEKTKAVLAQ
jgi:uncharacterized membrane protein